MKSVLFKVVASILLSCMCLTQTVTAQEMPIFEVQGTLSPVQKAFLSNAFKRAYSLLPLEMRKRLQKNSSFQSYKILPVVMDSHSVGEVQQGGKISINLNLLNTQNSELLNRTLIHELSHVYDLLPWQPQNLQVALMICSSWHDRSPPDYCEAYKRVETSVSTMPSFLDITGWYQKFGGKGERIKETTFINRSPDPYEKTNPKEMFAVNMEYFLTDPEYKCRRPSLYNYLSNHFMEEPFKDYNCQQNLTFIDPQFMDVNKAVRKIDPDRVYQIHYLYADAGDGLVSAFGHSMVRIVMCAPERKTVGPECIKDISNHIILSFRGFVDTPEFSGLNGLLGGYASNLFFLPLPQIIDEYTVQQFRNLYSYPVALTKEKIKAFLARAVETYWSYKNNYYFLTNNCATETMNLFRTSLGFKEHLEAAHVQTPIEVLQALQLNHLISHEVEFNDLSAAKEKGYFFPSIEKDLNLALDTLHKISVQVSNESMNEYSISEWLDLSPKDRLALYSAGVSRIKTDDINSRKKWIGSFLFLERFCAKKTKEGSYDYLIKAQGKSNSSIENKRQLYLQKISESLQLNATLTSPTNLTNVGYGIPTSTEIKDLEVKLAKIKSLRDQNRSTIDSLFNEIFQLQNDHEIEETQSNIQLFSRSLIAELKKHPPR